MSRWLVVAGALLARQATGASDVTICLEDNKPGAAEAVGNTAAGTDVRLKILHTKYPQGGEKQLISAVLAREVPTGGLPLDVGVVVFNVGTAAALARAVLRGKPLTHRIVTVSGGGVRQFGPVGAVGTRGPGGRRATPHLREARLRLRFDHRHEKAPGELPVHEHRHRDPHHLRHQGGVRVPFFKVGQKGLCTRREGQT